MKMKFRYILAGVAAFAALLSCSKDGGDDTEKVAKLSISAQMPQGVAADIKSVDITSADLNLSVDITDVQVADDLLNISVALPQGSTAPTEGAALLVHYNAPETDHTVYTTYTVLGADAFTDGLLGTVVIDATQSATHAGLPTCDGTTAENAYLVGDTYQLAAVNSLLADEGTTFFKMVDDVDYKELAWPTLDVDGKSISFDGDSHKISNVAAFRGLFANLAGSVQNLTIDTAVITADSQSVGVLADVLQDESSIKNVTVLNSSIENTKAECGGLVGHMKGGSIESSSAACSVDGGGYVGGLVGKMVKGQITDCSASGDVYTDYFYSGGLVAYIETGNVILTRCSASGKVTNDKTNYSRTGGLVGQFEDGGKVIGCFATGDVEAKGVYAGGLIGQMQNAEVDGCYATGHVQSAYTSYACVAGLIGQIEDASSVKNSYSTGNVDAVGSGPGGLIGNILNGGTVVKCYATGNVNTAGKHYVGGLVGIVDKGATIDRCYATGNVGDDKANRRGGLVGNVSSGTAAISNCYSTGSVVGASYNGGFIGGIEKNATVTVRNSYTKCTVAGGTWNSCVFAGLLDGTCDCKGFIGWNVSNRRSWAYGVNETPADNYMGTSGTISFQAGKFMNTEYKWDPAIWDLNGDDPQLR